MTPFFPIFELVDRYVIAMLKFNKTQANQEELDFYHAQLCKYDLSIVNKELENLHNIHSNIWNLEAELKSGRENKLTLEEIGRRAIEIRNWNNQRISTKNIIAEKLGQGNIKEIKKDHLSE
jgi:arginine/lysine/ornithine decarboxylase